MDITIVFGVGMFTAIVLALVMVILFARTRLVASGDVHIEINGEKTITVPAGGKLLISGKSGSGKTTIALALEKKRAAMKMMALEIAHSARTLA